MYSVTDWADSVWRKGIAPEPLLTVSEWAEEHRILPDLSAEPGRWQTCRTPFLAEIMNCLSISNPVERVVFQKGAQLGGTEAGLNWVGYVIHHAPGMMLMVQPSLEMVRRNTNTRIDPLIESSPVLRERVALARSKDSGNSTSRKKFPGGMLVMTGANSALGLRSIPARYLFLDEVDGYPLDADGEGDPIALAIQRTVTFRGRRKIFLVSTPTLKGFSRIEAAYLESDQRRYFVPCLHCGEFQIIEWACIRWPEGRRDKAFFACSHCGGIMEEHHKPRLINSGEWRPTAQGDGRTAGFHLSSLYSPFETWGEVAMEHGLVYKDPPRLKTWVNTKLGETWEDPAIEIMDIHSLMIRRETWGETLPANIVALTAGIDVQDNRLEMQVIGWGKDHESWSVAYMVFWGDPSRPEVWAELDNALLSTWPHERAIADVSIRSATIDTGGHHTAAAYDFCRSRLARRVWAIKGRGGQGVPVWPRKPSRSNKGNVPLFIVGVDSAKDALAARLRVLDSGPGYCHFPLERDISYFEQLTAERAVTRYQGGRPIRVWAPKSSSSRNEALDTYVYAIAALQGLVTAGFNLNQEAVKLESIPLKNAATPSTFPTQQKSKATIRSRWLDW